MTGTEEGMILLKCHGCKTPTLFRLQIRHETDEKFIAKTHCQKCEKKDPIQGLVVRSLEPKLVESQRIDPFCHEPEQPEDPYAKKSGGDSSAE